MKGLTLGIALGLTSLGSMAQENYKPKYNTLAHKMLETSGQKYITPKTLDEIIDSSKKLIEKKGYSNLELPLQLGFLAENMVSDPFVQLGSDRMATVLLGIAEENNLPIYGVLMPDNSYGYIRMRWDPDGKHDAANPENPINKGDFSWNPTTIVFFNDEKEPTMSKKELLGLSHYKYAKRLFRKKEFKKAIKKCNKAINLFPDLASSYELKGDCFYYSKKNKKAIKPYSKAIKKDPKLMNYIKRGCAFMKINENKKALEDYEKAKKLETNGELSVYKSFENLKIK